MNYDRLSVYCDLSPDAAIEVSLQTIADYLAFLYRVSRTGGPTTEEEIFVENLAASMEVEPAVLEKAILQSRDSSEDIRKAAAKLKDTPLRESAYLDACHLTQLDQEVSAEEKHALKQAEEGLELTSDFTERARNFAAGQERLLHIFCLLADRPDPADLWKIYLYEGLRQSDRQRRIILPDPETISVDERVAALALILKMSGVGWRRSAKESVVQNLTRYLALDPADQEAAMRKAWTLETSLRGLAGEIRSRPLQLVVLGDAYRVCLSDTTICEFERELLQDLIRQFGLDPDLTEKFIEMTFDEATFRESVRQLSQPVLAQR